MAAKSDIEWTDASWTPIRARNTFTGKIGWHCTHVSEGCRNCYAESINRRLGTGENFTPGAHVDRQGLVQPYLDERMVTAPLRWRKPRMVFVCSMTDLFADFVKDKWIDQVFAVMALCPQHTFQVLTKRSERMRDYFTRREFRDAHPLEVRHDAIDAAMNAIAPEHWCKRELEDYAPDGLPLPNVWLGVSAERQQEADERIPHLLQTPAAVRFVSLEPLLGPIDLTNHCNGHYFFDTLRGTRWHDDPDVSRPAEKFSPGLDWVIVGGESGPKARIHDIGWDRSIIAQCKRAGVAVFEKQLGSRPVIDLSYTMPEQSADVDPADLAAFSQRFAQTPLRLKDRKGGDWSEWPDDLRVREFPTTPSRQRSAA